MLNYGNGLISLYVAISFGVDDQQNNSVVETLTEL